MNKRENAITQLPHTNSPPSQGAIYIVNQQRRPFHAEKSIPETKEKPNFNLARTIPVLSILYQCKRSKHAKQVDSEQHDARYELHHQPHSQHPSNFQAY